MWACTRPLQSRDAAAELVCRIQMSCGSRVYDTSDAATPVGRVVSIAINTDYRYVAVRLRCILTTKTWHGEID